MANKTVTKSAGKAVGKAADAGKAGAGTLQQLPTERLRGEATKLVSAYGQHAVARMGDKMSGLTDRLTDYAENGGPGLKAAIAGGKAAAQGKSPMRTALSSSFAGAKEKVKEALGSGKKGRGGGGRKITNIVEYIDVGVPVEVAYNQWTQFQEFPSFMKKLENADQDEDTKIKWKAQIFWSHRTWESTIVDQEPDDHIVWKSGGAKGHVDGAVTFHELAPNLTRVLVVLEYHPKGLFEHTGNLWRAQGRRVRLELKHFRRHVMTQTLLHPDDVEGWRGEIKDSKVTTSHEDAIAADERSDEDERPDESDEDERDRLDEQESETDEEADSDEGDSDSDQSDEDVYDDEYTDEYDEEEEGGVAEDDETEDDDRPVRTRRRR